MYESGFATEIIGKSLSRAKDRPLKAVTVRLGVAGGVDKAILLKQMKKVAEIAGFPKLKIRVIDIPSRVKCTVCGREYEVPELLSACPDCAQIERVVLSGPDCALEAIEVERVPPNWKMV